MIHDVCLAEYFAKREALMNRIEELTGLPMTIPGIDVGDGWFPIVSKLVEDIGELIIGIRPCPLRFAQIKEKFADLRVYIDYDDPTDELYAQVESLIDKAEGICILTCETCSSDRDVHIRGGSWINRICLECFEKKG